MPKDQTEITLHLTPFEAAALLRALYHTELLTHSAVLPIIEALKSIKVRPASVNEIYRSNLESFK